MLQLDDSFAGRLEQDDVIRALAVAVDRVREPTPAPRGDFGDLPAPRGDLAGGAVDDRLAPVVRDIRAEWLDGCSRVGVTAGASTPEFLVREVVEYLGARGGPAVREFRVVEEDVRFGLPHELLEIARQKQAASAAS